MTGWLRVKGTWPSVDESGWQSASTLLSMCALGYRTRTFSTPNPVHGQGLWRTSVAGVGMYGLPARCSASLSCSVVCKCSLCQPGRLFGCAGLETLPWAAAGGKDCKERSFCSSHSIYRALVTHWNLVPKDCWWWSGQDGLIN